MRITKKNQLFLDGQHRMYCDYNQNERADCLVMESLKHPMADSYRKMRDFFDSLRYASNSSERYFTFKSVTDHSMFHAPEISLSWYPNDVPGYGHVYPAHDRWNDYISDCAAAGWPVGCEPSISMGGWTIRSTDSSLVDELIAFTDSNVGLYAARAVWGKYHGENTCTISIHCHDTRYTLRTMDGIKKIIQSGQKGFVLPVRTKECDAKDNAPLPLNEKTFGLGNVESLTVSDRKVLMPLVPLGVGNEVLSPLVNGLIQLIEQGFPFEQAKDWLKGFVKPSAYRKLEAKFSHTAQIS